MKEEKDTSDDSTKRIKTEHPIIVDDSDSDIYSHSDIKIHEARSRRKRTKSEPIDLTQVSDFVIDERRSKPRAITEEPIDLTHAGFEIDEERSSSRAIKTEPIDLTQVGSKFPLSLII
jgi:hypothetical protein